MLRFRAPSLALALSLALCGAAFAKPRHPAPPPSPPPAPADPAQTAAALRDKALTDSTAWDYVESLTTEVGPRLEGTIQAERGKDWGLAKLKELGFENVHAEPFLVTAWVRGAESAEVTAPFPQKLMIIGLGGSPSTPPGGIEAEIALFHSYAVMLAAPTAMAMPAPSSMAPWPGSHESIWPPMAMISSGFSEPGMSPTTFQAGALGISWDWSTSLTRTGLPRATMRSSNSASGTPSAAEGILGTSSSKSALPVCGRRLDEVEIERTR